MRRFTDTIKLLLEGQVSIVPALTSSTPIIGKAAGSIKLI
jgi:hypothetical protein